MKKTHKKVVLVALGTSRKEYPYMFNFAYLTAPGLHYINAVLRNNGFITSIINMICDDLLYEEISAKIIEQDPDIVLFNQFFSTRDRVRSIISQLPNKYIIGIGGHDATFHPNYLTHEEFLKEYSHADFVWQGEAENGLAEYLLNVKKGNGPVLVNNLNNRTEELDMLPILAHDDYKGDAGFIVTSRGCMTSGCDFCTTPQFYKEGWRARSIDHVTRELLNLKKNGKDFFWATDDNFFGFSGSDLDRGREIIRICRKLDLQLSILTTVKQILKADEKGYLAEFSGILIHVCLGVENGDTEILKKIGKKCDLKKYSEMSAMAIDALHRNSITTRLGYINFYPEATFEELKNSADFLYKNHQQAATFYHLQNKLNIFEGSKLFKMYTEKGGEVRVENAQYIYSFTNKNVGFLHNFLSMYTTQNVDILDYLDYEAACLIYMNQLLDTPAGKEYLSLKSEINENNYSFFINAIDICRNDPNIIPLMDLVNDFKNKVHQSILKYQAFIIAIAESAERKIKEALMYVDHI